MHLGLPGRSVLLCCLLAVLGCRGTAPEAESNSDKYLDVASDLANPPFAYLDEDGSPAGHEVEMIHALAAALGQEARWHRMEFGELLPAVSAGTVELACATIGITDERSKKVAFTEPYYLTDIAVVVRAQDPEVTRLADLSEAPVTAGVGTTSEAAVRSRLPRAVLYARTKDDSLVDLLLSRRVAAAVMDAPYARQLVRDYPSLTILPETLGSERYAIAVSQNNLALRQALNQHLAELPDLEIEKP